jgi:hypothetical protein
MLEERTRGSITRPGYEVCGMMRSKKAFATLGILALAAALPAKLAQAEIIKNKIAVFAALDKVTGRISHLEIPINQTVKFGALKVTPRVCDSRPATEAPDTASFVEVDEIKLSGEEQRIFTGWMFAESPGLNAVEHPVYDVWLTSCKTPAAPTSTESAAKPAPSAAAPAEAVAAEPAPTPAPTPAPPPAAAPKPKPAAAPEPEPLPWQVPGGANASSRSR